MLFARKVLLCMLQDHNNGVEGLLSSIDNLACGQQKSVSPSIPQFPGEGVGGVENTTHPIHTHATSGICTHKRTDILRYGKIASQVHSYQWLCYVEENI